MSASVATYFSTSAVAPALYATVNTLSGLDEVLYCNGAGSHSFFGGSLHCTTQFAMCEMRVQSNQGQVKFGGNAIFRLPKTGDQIYWIYAVIYLPGVYGAPGDGDTSACGTIPSFTNNGCNDYSDMAGGATSDVGAKVAAFLCNQEIYKGAASWFLTVPAGDSDHFGYAEDTADISYMPAEADYLITSRSREFTLPHELPNWVCYQDAPGFKLLKNVHLKIGAQKIVSLTPEYLFAAEEVAGKVGKRLREMVGKRKETDQMEKYDNLIVDSMQTRVLYVPLPFWFMKAPAHTLSILHLGLASVEVEIEFASLCKLLLRKNTATVVKKWDGHALADTDLNVVISTTHIWLPKAERDRLTAHGGQKVQIIQQVQKQEHDLTTAKNSIRLDFNMPTLELLFMVRRQCHDDINDQFNFTGLAGLDAIESVGLKVNSNAVVNEKEGSYFRLVSHYQHHPLMPKQHIYAISFALFPQEMIISGSLNFSRFETIMLDLTLQAGLASATAPAKLFVFAPCWNCLQYADGGATALFG